MPSTCCNVLTRLRLVSINDVYELANLPRLQSFLTKLSTKPSAVVLSGDFLSPSTLSSIDGGRGMISTLRCVGVTHVSLGNHEQDLRLESLRSRLEELTEPKSFGDKDKKSTTVLNSNMQRDLPPKAEWMRSVTKKYSVVESACGNVKVALLGLLSDEPGLFRDDTFKSVPIQNVLETYTQMYNKLNRKGSNIEKDDSQIKDDLVTPVDLVIPLTHESIIRDKELAQHMLSLHDGLGLIIGGHEHDPYHEIVTKSSNQKQDAIHIFKSGMEARNACLIDLLFELPDADITIDDGYPNDGKAKYSSRSEQKKSPRLVKVESELIDLTDYEPSPLAQKVVDKHMSVILALENEIIVDASSVGSFPNNVAFSSKRSRFTQTTIGGAFCQMIKEELEDCDVAILNGATIKGDITYDEKRISYAELKNELPFPTKMVVVEMTQLQLYRAIHYSRTAVEEGNETDMKEIPRRGYLQVDYDCDQRWVKESLGDIDFDEDNANAIKKFKNNKLSVALPRNLLNGFCKIKPLIDVGEQLKKEGKFPGSDDFVPAIELIVRHACKNRWYHILGGRKNFNKFDLNHDGVLDKHEIKTMMTDALGYEPADFVVDDMIGSIDLDENGTIDHDEFDILLAEMQRES